MYRNIKLKFVRFQNSQNRAKCVVCDTAGWILMTEIPTTQCIALGRVRISGLSDCEQITCGLFSRGVWFKMWIWKQHRFVLNCSNHGLYLLLCGKFDSKLCLKELFKCLSNLFGRNIIGSHKQSVWLSFLS